MCAHYLLILTNTKFIRIVLGDVLKRKDGMKIIVVSLKTPGGKSTGQYQAWPEGRQEIYAFGDSIAETVGNLVLGHQPELMIEVDYNGAKERQ